MSAHVNAPHGGCNKFLTSLGCALPSTTWMDDFYVWGSESDWDSCWAVHCEEGSCCEDVDGESGRGIGNGNDVGRAGVDAAIDML